MTRLESGHWLVRTGGILLLFGTINCTSNCGTQPPTTETGGAPSNQMGFIELLPDRIAIEDEEATWPGSSNGESDPWAIYWLLERSSKARLQDQPFRLRAHPDLYMFRLKQALMTLEQGSAPTEALLSIDDAPSETSNGLHLGFTKRPKGTEEFFQLIIKVHPFGVAVYWKMRRFRNPNCLFGRFDNEKMAAILPAAISSDFEVPLAMTPGGRVYAPKGSRDYLEPIALFDGDLATERVHDRFITDDISVCQPEARDRFLAVLENATLEEGGYRGASPYELVTANWPQLGDLLRRIDRSIASSVVYIDVAPDLPVSVFASLVEYLFTLQGEMAHLITLEHKYLHLGEGLFVEITRSR
jgi:hypothetical protein